MRRNEASGPIGCTGGRRRFSKARSRLGPGSVPLRRRWGERKPLDLLVRDVGAEETLNVLAAIEDGGYLEVLPHLAGGVFNPGAGLQRTWSHQGLASLDLGGSGLEGRLLLGKPGPRLSRNAGPHPPRPAPVSRPAFSTRSTFPRPIWNTRRVQRSPGDGMPSCPRQRLAILGRLFCAKGGRRPWLCQPQSCPSVSTPWSIRSIPPSGSIGSKVRSLTITTGAWLEVEP